MTDKEKPAGKKRGGMSSRGVVRRKITFDTFEAQRVIERCFDRVKYAMFSSSVILHVISENDDIDTLSTLITNTINNAVRDMENAMAQYQAIMDDAGIDEMIEYTESKTYNFEIDAPKLMDYVRAVGTLDKLIKMIDTCWINGEIDDNVKKDTCRQWQKRLVNMSVKIVKSERKVRTAIHDSENGKGGDQVEKDLQSFDNMDSTEDVSDEATV